MTQWENDLVQFLKEMTTVQNHMLELIDKNQQLLIAAEPKRLQQFVFEEVSAIEQMQACFSRREKLLQCAKTENLPDKSIETLGKHVITNKESEFHTLIKIAKQQARHLQLRGMTNWMITQRSLIHFSQLLEIIATRGKTQSTYTRGHNRNIGVTGGSIMDKKA